MSNQLHAIPKVDKLLDWPQIKSMLEEHPRGVVLQAVRAALDLLRKSAINGLLPKKPEQDELTMLVRSELERLTSSSLRPLVNGTGVVIHTNLGRSLLARSACDQIATIASRNPDPAPMTKPAGLY